jgi:nicotinamide-nucleotide amidase
MKLNRKLVLLLKKKKLKISLAESCTGGMLSSAITSIEGSSKVFSMGFVTYSNQAKIAILKVPEKVIKKHGAVSVECSLSMVKNLSKISKSNVCVSITGIAGPNGGTKKKTYWISLCGYKN